jgi:hypothetical protein
VAETPFAGFVAFVAKKSFAGFVAFVAEAIVVFVAEAIVVFVADRRGALRGGRLRPAARADRR